MKYLSLLWVVLLVAAGAIAGTGPSQTPPLSSQTRLDLVRAFNAELVYIRTPFPMGAKGLTLKDGTISPSGEQLQRLLAMSGPSVKPGDRVQISKVEIKGDRIHFEINGGPVKKQKWYQHISLSAGGGDVPIAPNDPANNPRGSYVDLVFDHYVPDLNPQQLKDLLLPVFDFNAKSAVEAYLETVPPKVKAAIQNHNVLVGMNREMVIYSKGRAEQKSREKDGDVEYEEWVYGQPPKDVDFVRFVGDEVVRVETMKVTGEKIVRNEKEVDTAGTMTAGKTAAPPDVHAAAAPTLRRPGEDSTDAPAANDTRSPSQPVAPPDVSKPNLLSSGLPSL